MIWLSLMRSLLRRRRDGRFALVLIDRDGWYYGDAYENGQSWGECAWTASDLAGA